LYSEALARSQFPLRPSLKKLVSHKNFNKLSLSGRWNNGFNDLADISTGIVPEWVAFVDSCCLGHWFHSRSANLYRYAIALNWVSWRMVLAWTEALSLQLFSSGGV
jgi:hypothetical protein